MTTSDYNSRDDQSASEGPLSVSEVTSKVKEVLEESLPMCWVVGEISDFKHHSSGHRYFTLVDEVSQLSCVMFKWQARKLAFAPEPGIKVMVYGHISVYERGGRYQFYAAQLQPAGIGAQALAFEQLKNRLEQEGLFDQERKRSLPPYPQTIGIVTSHTGAAIRDIIQILSRRAPGIQLILRPTQVQGPSAAADIAQGIADLNRHAGADILIVGRGGGAPEDLWPFNEETVARAIYHSTLPVIAAVGHEIDYSIADYVADYRAPTPSAAAEIVAQERSELLRRIQERRQRLLRTIDHRLNTCDQHLQNLRPERLFRRLADRLEQRGQYVDERRNALATAFDWQLRTRVESLRTASLRLEALSPLSGLARGFSLCERTEDGYLVRSSKYLKTGDQLRLRFQEGGAICCVEEVIDE